MMASGLPPAVAARIAQRREKAVASQAATAYTEAAEHLEVAIATLQEILAALSEGGE